MTVCWSVRALAVFSLFGSLQLCFTNLSAQHEQLSRVNERFVLSTLMGIENTSSALSKYIEPYSYSRYWTGTSLQPRLMRGVFSKANDINLPRMSPHCKLQWATKVLRHLAVKFDFRASWTHFSSPFPPQTMLIFLFLGLHRPQRIELGGQGYQRINARCE